MTTANITREKSIQLGGKISRRLLLFLIPITLILIAITIYFSYSRLYSFQDETYNENLFIRHEFTIDAISQWAQEGHMILQDFAISENLQNQYEFPITDETSSNISGKLVELTDNYSLTNRSYYNQVFIIDNDGRVLASSNQNFLNVLLSREFIYVNFARQGLGGTYFVEDLTSMFPQQSIIQIYPLVTDIGNPNGAIIGIGDISNLLDIISDTSRIFPESELFIVSQDQNFYQFNREANQLIIQNLSEEQKENYESLFSINSINAGTVFSENLNFDNQEVNTAFNWEPTLNMGFGTSFTSEELYQQYYFNLAIFILVIVILLIIFGLITRQFITSTLSPIQKIIHANHQLSLGEWNFKLPSLNNSDFVELSESYIKLLDRLMRMGFLPADIDLETLSNSSEDQELIQKLLVTSEDELMNELENLEHNIDEFTSQREAYEQKIRVLKTQTDVFTAIVAELNLDNIFSTIEKALFQNYSIIEGLNFYLIDHEKPSNIRLVYHSRKESADEDILSPEIENVLWSVNNRIVRKKEIKHSNKKESFQQIIVPIIEQNISYGALVIFSSTNTIFLDENLAMLESISQSIGKIINLKSTFDKLKESIIHQSHSSKTPLEKEQQISFHQKSSEFSEDIKVKYVDITKDQQAIVDQLLEDFHSIQNFDTLLKQIVKEIGNLPHVSETVIQSFSEDDEQALK